MRLDELIAKARREGQDDVISFERLASASPYGAPSVPRYVVLGRRPKETDLIDTPWGTKAASRGFPDPASLMGVARSLGLSPRTVVLAAGTSVLGIDLFDDPFAESAATLPRGWHTLVGPRYTQWHQHGATLIADQEREQELELLRARNAELEARNAELEGAATKAPRREATGKSRRAER